MLPYLTLLCVCQLAGELLAQATGLPVPGPVCGMVLLYLGLVVRGSVPAALADVGAALLGNLSLLFIPAGVGVMLHAGLLSRNWLALSVALVVSTVLTIAVTALVMQRLAPPSGSAGDRPETP